MSADYRGEVRDVRLEQLAQRDWALSADETWGDPSALLVHLRNNTKHLAAFEFVD